MLETYLILMAVLLLFVGVGFLLANKKQQTLGEKIKLDELTILIPFRNEAEKLPELIESIKKLHGKLPELIFVNDHSEDNSVEILHNAGLQFSLLELKENQYGKKTAIHEGVLQAKTKYILTWDADIVVPKKYFELLEQVKQADLLILPVKMTGNKPLDYFSSLDIYFVNVFSFALSAFSKPIVAGGANLLFKKENYLNYYAESNSLKYSSGDDAFLLQAMKEQRAEISVVLEAGLCVETESPGNFSAFMKQRLRWVGKTRRVGDQLASSVGVAGLIYQFFSVVALFTFKPFWVILVLKIAVETVIFSFYLWKIKELKRLIFLVFFCWIYPLYMLFIAFASLLVKVDWKGRKVVS